MSKKLERDSCSFYTVSTKGKIKSGTCSEVKTLDLFSLPRPIISHPPPLDKPDYVPVHEGSKKKVALLKEKKEMEQVRPETIPLKVNFIYFFTQTV